MKQQILKGDMVKLKNDERKFMVKEIVCYHKLPAVYTVEDSEIGIALSVTRDMIECRIDNDEKEIKDLSKEELLELIRQYDSYINTLRLMRIDKTVTIAEYFKSKTYSDILDTRKEIAKIVEDETGVDKYTSKSKDTNKYVRTSDSPYITRVFDSNNRQTEARLENNDELFVVYVPSELLGKGEEEDKELIYTYLSDNTKRIKLSRKIKESASKEGVIIPIDRNINDRFVRRSPILTLHNVLGIDIDMSEPTDMPEHAALDMDADDNQ